MTNPTEQRTEYIAGLRKLADVLEGHPEVPLPYEGSHPQYARMTFHFLFADDPRAAMAATRRALGVPLEKKVSANDQYFDLSGNLRGLHFSMTAYREAVCERVVVASREVEVTEPDPEAVAALPQVTRLVTVEDVEWKCSPLLAEAQDGAS